jgi:hypothetical protein
VSLGRPSLALCTEAVFREGLDDAEFWDYVLLGVLPGAERFDDGPWDDGPCEEGYLVTSQPCPVCQSTETCGYDEQGRPFIHAVPAALYDD